MVAFRTGVVSRNCGLASIVQMEYICLGEQWEMKSVVESRQVPLVNMFWRQKMKRFALALLCAIPVILAASCRSSTEGVVFSGEMKKWHNITVTFDGPNTGETADPNPFRQYRLEVTFVNGNRRYVVPGYYAADGNAAQTGSDAGNKWRVHFVPDEEGRWSYTASFRAGPDIALSNDPTAGSPIAFDGVKGTFTVAPTDKTGRDHRAKGLLKYVGLHHLQFAETGEYFLKGGADSPENFLAYFEFDGTYDAGGPETPGLKNGLHRYGPHAGDWKPGDSTWKNGKGKNIIGALNYLSSTGINSLYFITYNIDGGDGQDVWPWTNDCERRRFDCSKLDQWEIVFSHIDRVGIQLHFLLQESENDLLLGGSGDLNPVRKLYYREMVARFAHHLALIWNLGEENNNSDAQRKSFAQYIRTLDPYDHPITVHTHWDRADTFYNGLLGNADFEATSIQGHHEHYNRWAVSLRARSREAGRPWAIYGDEQMPAVDKEMKNLDSLRINALWGNLMGGGGGVEWFFPFLFGSEDWRTGALLHEDTAHALHFFQTYLPFWQMEPANVTSYPVIPGPLQTYLPFWKRGREKEPDNGLVSAKGALCLAKPGQIYAIYLPQGGTTNLDLGNRPTTYTVRWYDPRNGGPLQTGTVAEIKGPGPVAIGRPPGDKDKDWVVLIKWRRA
jgi:hypothetical protein